MFLFLPIGDVNPRERTPVVNYTLVAANVAVFLAFGLGPHYDRVVEEYGFTPARPELPDAFTSMFLHADFFHVGGNMLFLWIVGDNVEDKLGHFRYLVLYLTTGLAAIGAHWLLAAGSPVPCIGASGAIAGMLGAYVYLFPHSRIRFWYLILFGIVRTGVTEIAAIWAIGFWFGEQLLLQLAQMSTRAMTGVAYAAHVGGFLFGLLMAVMLHQLGAVERVTTDPEAGRLYRPRPVDPYRRGSSWNREDW